MKTGQGLDEIMEYINTAFTSAVGPLETTNSTATINTNEERIDSVSVLGSKRKTSSESY